MQTIPPGVKRLPYDTIEVINVSPDEIFLNGLGELAEYIPAEQLAGWGFFKKIGRAFKKIGKKIKKFKFSKIFKVAIPLAAGAVLGPLAAAPVGLLSKKFGGTAARLLKGGAIIPRQVMTRGGPVVSLVTKNQNKILDAILGGRGRIATEAAVKRATGKSLRDLLLPGAKVKNGKLELPIIGTPTKMETETIPAKPEGFINKHGKKIAIGAAAAAGIFVLTRALKK